MNRIRLAGAALGLLLLTTATACSDDSPALGDVVPQDSSSSGGAVDLPEGATDGELGYCKVDVTGGVTTSFTGPGGNAAFGYGPWYPEGVNPAAMDVALDETFFILNCIGEGSDFVGFVTNTGESIPMAPGTYVLEPSDGGLGLSSEGTLTPVIGFTNSATNWGIAAASELVITEFDDEHIAGTFTLQVADVLAADGAGEGTATVTGEFEFRNPY